MLNFLNKYDAATTVGQLSVPDFFSLMLSIILVAYLMVIVLDLLSTGLHIFTSYYVAKFHAVLRRRRNTND